MHFDLTSGCGEEAETPQKANAQAGQARERGCEPGGGKAVAALLCRIQVSDKESCLQLQVVGSVRK